LRVYFSRIQTIDDGGGGGAGAAPGSGRGGSGSGGCRFIRAKFGMATIAAPFVG